MQKPVFRRYEGHLNTKQEAHINISFVELLLSVLQKSVETVVPLIKNKYMTQISTLNTFVFFSYFHKLFVEILSWCT